MPPLPRKPEIIHASGQNELTEQLIRLHQGEVCLHILRNPEPNAPLEHFFVSTDQVIEEDVIAGQAMLAGIVRSSLAAAMTHESYFTYERYAEDHRRVDGLPHIVDGGSEGDLNLVVGCQPIDAKESERRARYMRLAMGHFLFGLAE